MQITESMLGQLEAGTRYSNIPYSDDVRELGKWEAALRPHVWKHAESAKGFHAYYDVGYGFICLFRGEKLIDIGKENITHPDVVYLDKEYYGVANCLFFPAND